MFHSARIKLTAWYLLIIMVISISFSVAIYEVLNSELHRVERIHQLRIENRLPSQSRILSPDLNGIPPRSLFLDPGLINETENRLGFILVLTNLAILGTSAIAGYFLAGRTLKPISEMVNEQNLFITDASHELRTPLTSLKSEIEVNLRDQKLTLDQAKKLLSSNLEEVNNLQVLSDRLIKLTKYQKGDNNLQFTKLSLALVAEEATKKIDNFSKSKNIKIKNQIKNHYLDGDKQSLLELLVIFLDNAVKYSPKNSEVTLKSLKTDSHIEIQIIDQGIGISSQNIPHLFDRFRRAEKSRTKSDVSGYGLGLAIAKQIIERHHGSIRVQSKLNKGTTFTIQLPQKHLRQINKFSKLSLSFFG